MHSKIVFIICGPPGVGKTTISNALMDFFRDKFTNKNIKLFLLSREKFMKSIIKFYPEFIKNAQDYNDARKIHMITTELIIKAFDYLVSIPESIIVIEDGSPNRRLREYVSNYCNKHKVPYLLIYLHAPIEVIIDRRKEIAPTFLKRFIKSFEVEMDKKPKKNHKILFYNTDSLKPDCIVKDIIKKTVEMLK